MMKTLIKAAVAATVATGLFASPALAANTATAPFTAKATIVKPLTLVNRTDLDFGTITMAPALTMSTVTVALDGSISCGANLTCPAGQAAKFDVTAGVANQDLLIAVDSTIIELVNTTDSTKKLGFAANSPSGIKLDGLGLGTFNVGGTVTVRNTTADGQYEAVIPVTVSYL